MTVIRPNSVSGITSITAQANEINFFRSNGTLAGLQLNGVNFNTTTGVSTFNNLNVGGVLTYQDVTNVDSVGIITARSTIDAQGDISIVDKIVHTGDTNTAIRFPSADTISFETAGSERLRIYSDGDAKFSSKLGVGVEPVETFDVRTTGSAIALIGSTNASGAYLKLDGDSNGDGSGGDYARLVHDTDGRLYIDNLKSTADIVFRNTSSATERLRIKSNGQIVLGSDGSNSELTFSQDGSTGVILNSTTTGFGGYNTFTVNSAQFVHKYGGNERLRIDGNGDINLGNNPTNQYGYKLNIQDNSILYAQTASSGGTELKLYLDHGNTVANFGTVTTSHLAFVTANTERLRIKSDGTVVFNNTINTIHTNSNDSKLVLFGGSNNSVSNGGVLSLHGITNSSGNYTDLSAGAGGHIQFRSGTSEKFRITAGGEVLCGVTTTGTDGTKNLTLHAGSMMRVSNFYMGRVHGSGNNGNAAIVLHKLGQNIGFQMSGSMTFHSYTGSAYLSGCIVVRYNNDSVSRDVSLQKADSGMNLQLVTGTISGVSGNYLAIKKNGGGTGVCYINGHFAGNIESHGGIREVSNANWTTTAIHGTGITGGNDSSSS